MHLMSESFLTELYGDLLPVLEEYVSTLVRDSSEFTVVDGEEGDHGKIKYTDPVGGKLICTMVSEGGDYDDYEFTKWGRGMFLAKLEAKIRELGLENEKQQE